VAIVVVVVGGSVSGGTTVVTTVVGAIVVVVVGAVVAAGAVVVVAGGALVTVKPAVASSAGGWLNAWMVAGPPDALGGTANVPENVGDPLESAVPIVLLFEPCTNSTVMQFGLPEGHAWKLLNVIVKHQAGRATSGGHGVVALADGVGGPLVGSTVMEAAC